ncbi:MAG: hypothetical protein JRD68_07070 [Deltaproteobacteria bacterium]|nr:hypothetical protein [Deltaproteobacteria bacterium]
MRSHKFGMGEYLIRLCLSLVNHVRAGLKPAPTFCRSIAARQVIELRRPSLQ